MGEFCDICYDRIALRENLSKIVLPASGEINVVHEDCREMRENQKLKEARLKLGLK